MSTPKKILDLSRGSVLHIENFKTSGFDPKDKYVYVVAHEDPANVFAFVISSQRKYSIHPCLSREQVHIPAGTLPGLPVESWIQCFHEVHRLNIAELESRYERGEVTHKGKLSTSYQQRVRNVVECSDVLRRYEIADCLDAIDNDKSKG